MDKKTKLKKALQEGKIGSPDNMRTFMLLEDFKEEIDSRVSEVE